MPNRASAVDSIAPAFLRTKQLLLQPFRLGLWARFAVVAIITGEAGGTGGGFSNLGSLANNRGGKRFAAAARFLDDPSWNHIQPYLFWIVLGFVLLVAVLLLWIYSDCVYRFILLDSVLTGKCRLVESWRRWKYAGRRYLLWVIAFGFSSLVVFAGVVGVPALLAYRAGWFEKPDQHLLGLVLGGLLFVLVLIVVLAALAIINLLARDFLIPVMAFEDVGAMEGWERLMTIVSAEKGAYALYVLMKIVLNVASGIIFGIANFIVILILLIPLGIIGVAVFFIGRGAGLTLDDPSTVLLLIALGLLAFAGILYVIGFVYSPGLVFFQSYTLLFFGARYEPLRTRMYPTTPPPPTPAPLVPPGDPFPPPEPSLA
ncbi:MAG TPA: hypothetical protein VKH15_04230 [Candidatus Acidoferrum sp.]|nr:hypothetical protein [Candidatus Acidoferrum sp.]